MDTVRVLLGAATASTISLLRRSRRGWSRPLLLVLSGLTISSLSLAGVFENRVVGRIETPDLVRDCLFFTLQGVAGTDTNAPADPWFVVPRTHPGFREIYGALLTARASGALVSVFTTGALESSCGGHYGVSTVIVEP